MKKWIIDKESKLIQVLSGRSNAYLLQSGSKSVLIDTGKKNVRTKLTRNLKKLGIVQIDFLILTHTHFDHCQNAAYIQKEFKASIIVSKNAKRQISDGFSPLPKGTTAYYRKLIELANRLGEQGISFEPFSANEYIDAETILKLGSTSLELFPTPGHSSDSISIQVNHQYAIVGDTLFGVIPGSVFPPFADQPHRLSEQWEKLYDTGCTIFLPGHGRPIARKLLKKCLFKIDQ
ncbi:MAG: MBL fold metallo-hydrolase [Prolixibacteraceae bacterium]